MSGLYTFLMGNVVTFILVLSLLVFVHEMGHYLVGRWSGIRILAFSVGFGPEIFGFTDRHGTRWKISAIPLGGYVRFFGDEDVSSKPDNDGIAAMSEEDRARSFAGAKLWKRAATVAAGPIANFLLAIAIFAVLFSVYGRMIADPVVAEVAPDGAAAAAGILPGDLLVAIDGNKVETFDDVRRYVAIRPSQKIIVTVERGGQKLDVPMVPQRTDRTDQFGNKIELGQIGIITNKEAGNFRLRTYTPLEAVREGVIESAGIVTGTFKYIANIFAGSMRADQLGGPIRVAQASGQMASLGIGAVLQLAAALSVSIGLLNLMPVPVLDGGHLMFYAVEAVRGRPLGSKAQEIAFRIGLAMILTLMVFTTWNDISVSSG
ncbi:UNVERIFIED_ORG: regulator of sigma E protease [Rhizobium etli]|uniref:Zinc metalloprotease n=1 Tax=Rhizobium etli bv. mimosae str. IE4771 TaxID=1432050 RepID=A0A060I6L6_RHIET|nr:MULTISPECIES: RIP metalloprotease RseP [Rhizobium]AJC79176.1 Zn-dependent metallopeptidase protein [Rhizobium etli bv. phaseoli str. IE4803]AIC27161.1 Zn-dependent metallopeptidase protein [Rhizobium sp. IE4771]ARQ58132.1 Zn-dependent metallopeptidase protein [Rhizobium sp. Kim5]PCK85285.1 RIP metalloprotease RseP [Rhizobium sophoriradicis]RSC20579.1 RIP metalloprotease RseP [Rhizobium sophoriradicis]